MAGRLALGDVERIAERADQLGQADAFRRVADRCFAHVWKSRTCGTLSAKA